MVGAACALYAARAGLDVILVDRGPVAGGTTGAGEGNLLVSDKEPGPELDLALLSGRLWGELAAEFGAAVEYEAKGGVVVASSPDGLAALERFADGQRAAGVVAEPVTGATPCTPSNLTSPPVCRAASTIPRTARSCPPWPPPTSPAARAPVCSPAAR